MRRAVVVGAGNAGLAATLRLVELGVAVDLISLGPARRSHSTCDTAGINAAFASRGDGDSPRAHFEDAAIASRFLAHQPPLRAMTEAAPRLVSLLDRAGVPFRRTPEGKLDAVRLPGSSRRRTALAGAATGLHVTAALDEQLRRFETNEIRDGRSGAKKGEPLVRRFEGWDLVATVRDDAGTCVGVVAQDLQNMAFRAFVADGVIVATGGPCAMFGGSTASVGSTGSAAARLFREGVVYANPELVQIHPTAMRWGAKSRVVPDFLRASGARLWLGKNPKDERIPGDIPERERDYLVERMSNEPGTVANDEVLAALLKARAADSKGDSFAYLDVAAAGRASTEELASFLDGAARVSGLPSRGHLRVGPAVECALGGLWVDFEPSAAGGLVAGSPRNQATSVPGLYAAGEVEYQFAGAGIAPGDAMLAAIFAGELAADAVTSYREAMLRSALDLPRSTFDRAEKRETEAYAALLARDGDADAANAYTLHHDLAQVLRAGATTQRSRSGLEGLADQLDAIDEQARRVAATDTGSTLNQGAPFVRHLDAMLLLARAVVLGATAREESRGSHVRADHPDRDDARFAKTTLVRCRAATGDEAPRIELIDAFDYACVGKSLHVTGAIDTSSFAPARPRKPPAGVESEPPEGDAAEPSA